MNDDILWLKDAVAKLDMAAVTIPSWAKAQQAQADHTTSRVDLLSSSEEALWTEDIFSIGSEASAGLPACSIQPAMHEITVRSKDRASNQRRQSKAKWYQDTPRGCQHELSWDPVQSKTHSGMMVEQSLQGVKMCLTSGGEGHFGTWLAFLKGVLPSNLSKMPFSLSLQVALYERYATNFPFGLSLRDNPKTNLQVATVKMLSWAGA